MGGKRTSPELGRSMPDPTVLAPFLDDDPVDFPGLVISTQRFIDAWLEAGGEPTDDLIIGFYGIESQVYDVKGGQQRAPDELDFYRTFYQSFICCRDQVARELRASEQP